MEADSWSRLSSKRHNPPMPPRFDMYLGFEDAEGGEGGGGEAWSEMFPPIYTEGDDIDYLCDEHPAETKAGICPICQTKVGSNIFGHLSMEHGSFLKGHGRRRIRKFPPGSHSSLSSSRKERREENLQFFHGGQPYGADSLNAAPDPLLTSFIRNFPVSDSLKGSRTEPSDEGSISNKTENVKKEERVEPPLSLEDRHERTSRSEFARGLVLSTIFDDH